VPKPVIASHRKANDIALREGVVVDVGHDSSGKFPRF
jgi:hypothetical protein